MPYNKISTNKEARWTKASHPVTPLKLYFKSLVGKCLTNEIKLGNMYNLAALDLRDINKTNKRWCSFSRYCLSVKLETNLVLWGVV